MCGILFWIEQEAELRNPVDLLKRIHGRGPDSLHTRSVEAYDHRLSFTSSVLHLRGSHVVRQPISNDSGDVLCWNGEAWSGLNIDEAENDTAALFAVLTRNPTNVDRVLESIKGPYAIVYYQVSVSCLVPPS